MTNVCAGLINQFVSKYQTIFSARFEKQGEDNQPLDETGGIFNLSTFPKLTETDIDNNHLKFPLEQQIQQY